MVVGVRKNRMINIMLLENKLGYILCVVGVSVTNVEWAGVTWWFVKLHQCCWLACWFVYLCVHFNILPWVLWNLNQLWLGYWFDSGVVGLEILWYCFWKCESLLFVPLLKFSAISQTWSMRHPNRLPVTICDFALSQIYCLLPFMIATVVVGATVLSPSRHILTANMTAW